MLATLMLTWCSPGICTESCDCRHLLAACLLVAAPRCVLWVVAKIWD